MATILITGASSGMGLATAAALAAQGHRLLLAVRSRAAMTTPLKPLQRRHRTLQADVVDLDLASLQSVRQLAQRIGDDLPAPEVMVLNAGVMTPPFRLTEDGFESQFQVNYLGHFELFRQIHGRLPPGALRRVISISSLSSERARNTSIADFARLARCPAAEYDALRCYRESKLAQVMFARSLADRYADTGMRSASVHPGLVNTNLFYRQMRPVVKAAMQPLAWLGHLSGRLATPARGARTAVALAGGQDFSPNGMYWYAGRVHPHNPLADDRALRDALWAWSEAQLSMPAAIEGKA